MCVNINGLERFWMSLNCFGSNCMKISEIGDEMSPPNIYFYKTTLFSLE